MFRNVLYWAGFQSPFPYQYDEDAARSVVWLTEILKDVCAVEFGSPGIINDCYGTFWSDHVGAYGEVNEWVQGSVTDPVLDKEIFIRNAKNAEIRRRIAQGEATKEDLIEPCDEVSRKRVFMDRLVALCGELGIEDMARQVYWWTGASQPNVMTRRPSQRPDGAPDFVWIDRRPGLPGFITSPGDFVLLPKAIIRGSIPPFDRINFEKLRAWPKAPDRARWESLVDRLEEADRRYRDGQVDLFSHHARLLFDRKLLGRIRDSRLDCWEKAERIDASTRAILAENPLLLLLHMIVILLPFVGARLQKLIGNGAWRKAVGDFILDTRYRDKVLFEARAYRIWTWLLEERTTSARARICYHKLGAYLKDWLCYFWAPASWQRFFTDQAVQNDLLKRFFTSPFRYVFSTSYRAKVNTDWMHAQTLADVKRGYISAEDAERLIAVAGDRPLQQYITGIIYTATVKPVSEISYVFGFIVLVQSYLKDLRGLGLWIVPIVAALLSISPAGVLRFLYALVMGILNPKVPYWTAIVMAPIRGVGDLAFPAQMAKTYPAFASYLLTSSVCKLAEHIPVFGERGGLLAIWTVTVLLSWPASFGAWRRWRKIGDAIPKTAPESEVAENHLVEEVPV
jgi:hypothetical protein